MEKHPNSSILLYHYQLNRAYIYRKKVNGDEETISTSVVAPAGLVDRAGVTQRV
jgi:hypothetical protein